MRCKHLVPALRVGSAAIFRRGQRVRVEGGTPAEMDQLRPMMPAIYRLLYPRGTFRPDGPGMCSGCAAFAGESVSAMIKRLVFDFPAHDIGRDLVAWEVLGEELQMCDAPGGLLNVVRHVCPIFETELRDQLKEKTGGTR